jgi:hypothetical protein
LCSRASSTSRRVVYLLQFYIYILLIEITILYNDIVFPFGIDPDTGDYGYYKAGADTVTPFKTGATIVYLGRQTPGSNYNITINVSATIPDYQSLTIDNFFIVLPYDTYKKARTSNAGGNRDNTIGIFAASGRSYNSTTGIFAFNTAYSTFHHNNGQYYYVYADVDVYCVY